MPSICLNIKSMLCYLRSSPVIRRLLALWVVVSLLGFSSAWAMDLHESPLQGHDSQHEFHADGISADEHDDAPACDHCCHGLSHLMGLSTRFSAPAIIDGTHGSRRLCVLFDSRTPIPDLRPPIA